MKKITNTTNDMTEKKAILWDIGNVLIAREYTNAFARLKDYINPMTAMYIWAKKDEFMAETRKELDLLETGRMTLEQFFSRLKGKIGAKMAYEQFNRVWCEIFDIKADVVAYARDVSRQYDSYFVSNTNREHYEHIQRLYPGLDFVKGSALSYELGVMKPAAEFYTKALALFGKRAEECVFIDDNANNIAAARELGIDSIHFSSLERLRSGMEELGITLDWEEAGLSRETGLGSGTAAQDTYRE